MTRHAVLFASMVALSACSQAAGDPSKTSDAAASADTRSGAAEQGEREPEIDPQSEEERAVADAVTQDTIPARFHGKWAESAEHCAIRGHQQYRIGAEEVGFFESRGIVQTVRVDGDYAAATLSEQYGDAPPAVYVFYMAREDEDAMGLRYDKEDRFSVVRCPEG